MKYRISKILLIILIISIVLINYLSFKNFRAQNFIILDNPSYELTYKDIDSLLTDFPNISATAMPLDIWRVQYLIFEGRYSEAKEFVKKAVETNPHVYVGEFLMGKLYYTQKKYDSAFYFSKKAFYGWPKNIEHYNSYVDVLEKTLDTLSLINAYNSLDSTLKKRSEYFNRFYSSFNKIKLSYLITNYPDERPITLSDIVGEKWERVYNFPNNQVIRDSTLTYFFKDNTTVLNKDNQEFRFDIKNDTFNFYYKSRPSQPISSFNAKYSDAYETLIFYKVPVENNRFQDQYFKKISLLPAE